MVRRPIQHVLTVSGLSKAYAGFTVLDDLDLTIRSGEILGVVGCNGVGKSTLMQILAGALLPDAGEIVLGGTPYQVTDRDEGRRRGIGYVPQRLEIDPTMTVAQALFRWTAFAGRPHEAIRDSAASLLSDTGVHIDPDAVMGDLVRTEQSIVEAVRMLAEDASLVIMDEVAATFTVEEIADLHRITALLTHRGRSIVYISHRLHEVAQIADRIAVMRSGYVSVELNPRRVTLADIAQEMQEQDPGERPDRTGHVSDDVVLSVRGMSSDLLHGVDLDVRRGEVLGLVGPSGPEMTEVGAGIAGRTPVTVDRLQVFGRDRRITSPEDAAALRIAYLADDDVQVAREYVAPAADEDDVDIDLGQVLSELSGGEMQQLALTRLMTADEDLVILNHPTRNLDVNARQRVYAALAAHTNGGRSAILISTEVDELLHWCDRVVFLRDGAVESVTPAVELDADRVQRGMRELAPEPT